MNGGTNNMNPHRLANVTHSEVAHCLPLPSLPTSFGASNPALYLFDEESATKVRATNDSAVLAHAGKIAELLKSTDISYLSLRDKDKHLATGIRAEPGSLLQAVLQHDPEAFSCAPPAPSRRRSLRNPVLGNTGVAKSSPHVAALLSENHAGASSPSHSSPRLPVKLAIPIFDNHVGSSSHIVSPRPINQPSPPFSDNNAADIPSSSKKSRMKRKSNSRAKADENDSKCGISGDSGGIVIGLCDLLDELFERTDAPGEDEGEESGTFLSLAEIKTVAEDIADLRAKNALQLVSTERLIKLLTLLDRHVQRSQLRDIYDDDDVDSESVSLVMSALEAVQISLLVMTVPSMPKQLYKEEIIDRIIEFSRYQIVHSVFSAYDPVYRQLHKRAAGEGDEDDDDEDDEDESGGKKGRRKSKSNRGKRSVPARISGSVSNVLHKLCSILGLLKDLLAVERLVDSTVLQLTKTVLATFSVDNIQLLQLKAIGVACMVFDLYPQHRTIILDEIISQWWKGPSSKRSLRTFQLPDEGASKQVQMLTALLLQLVQCSVCLPSTDAAASDSKLDSASGEKSSARTVKCFESAMDCCTYFWKGVLQKWAAPKAQEGADIKAVVENIVIDLLSTLNVPEFPAASLLLQVLCILLFGAVGIKAKDAVVRGAAIDLLGQVAARLKHDAVKSSNEKLWILQEIHGKGMDGENEAAKKSCVICAKSKGNFVMVPCDGCRRWFHANCVGVVGHDLLGRSWLCHYCLCKRQLASLRSEVKPQSTGGPSLPRNKKVEEVDNSKEGTAVVQQILLNYLQEAATSDSISTYSHRFYVCQWFRDDGQAIESLQFFHSRSMAKAPLQDFGSAPAPLSRNVILKIALALGQQRPLARGFDRILERLLASLQENSPTPRAKALRAVSAVVEMDPDVLGDERVQRAVEGRFLDSAISVREAAMELVGRHIVSRPDFAVKYFEKIAERIMDTGVSVRKRVIKIIRDVCMSNSGFAKATDGCIRIISRINDEESSIQDLVGKTFFELWFEEPSNSSTQYVADGSVVPLEIAERTQQLVDVLRCLPNNQSMVSIIKRSLALDFCPQTVKNSSTSSVTQAAVRHRCELMCKCLLESILKVEETATEDTEIRALPYVMALHAFCTVDPTLCAPASDPSRYAVTLQPYLKTQVDSRDAAQLLQSIVFVIDTVLPLLRRPSQSFVEELERDLRQLIVRYSFSTVVYACIKCLCSLSKVAVKGVNSVELLVGRFFKFLDSWRKTSYSSSEKPNVLRYLFCLGVLVRFGSDLIEVMEDSDVDMQQLLGLYKYYMTSPDSDVKAKALQSAGFVFIAKPDCMMEREMGKLIEDSLSADADPRLKIQMLRNFSDYLIDVEERMGSLESSSEVDKREVRGHAVPVAAGAGDNNIAGGIIQLHWDTILERCLDSSDQVRLYCLKVIEIVLRQGLVHPMTCVPHLIALEVDQSEANAKLAHRLLVQLNEKYPSFFESRLGDGLQLSFSFILRGASSSVNSLSLDPGISAVDAKLREQSTSKSAKAGIARIYKLIRSSRPSRNKFLSSVIRKFDNAATGVPTSVPCLVYCAEVLSSLPFGLPDEPLYIVYTINRAVQILSIMAVEREQEDEQAYNVDATEDVWRKSSHPVDDTEGIPSEAFEKLKMDCNAAMALALLLRLKRHLKIIYSLNDARCQAYTPSETIKPGEILSRRDVKEFSTRELPVESPTTVRQMLEQYQAFKRLLKEDAVDYSTYTANIPTKKRGRATAASHGETVDGGHANGFPVPTPTRTLRRKSTAAIVDHPGSGESGEDSDEEWGSGGGKKRKKAAASGTRVRGSRKSVGVL
ncbi:hypothetical protein R1flu_014000 [Riccia fluitans]|uniref:Sister chromatid cohesion protein n=1 Tax=Riccia fluitans TaxID=41844 RepID=A0ABD1YEV0_9MARC